MKIEIKNSLSGKRTLIALAFFAVLFGALAIYFGEIISVVSSAFVAALVIFDFTPKRALTVCVCCALSLGNLLYILFSGSISLFGFATVAVGLVIGFSFLLHRSKTECGFLLTIIFLLFTVASAVLLIMEKLDNFSFSALSEYGLELYESLKSGFVDYIEGVISELGNGAAELSFSTEDISLIFDRIANLLIAFLIIASFLMSGITLKIFTYISAQKAKDSDSILDWNFYVPSLFGYFYVILYIVSFFMQDLTVFSVTVLNLYYVFMFVFAYQGYRFVTVMISAKRSMLLAHTVVIAAIILFSSFAVEMLSLAGVFFAIITDKSHGKQTDD